MKIGEPYFQTIDQICQVLGVQVGDLFEHVEMEEKPRRKAAEIKSKVHTYGRSFKIGLWE
jgi:hypothetical protein